MTEIKNKLGTRDFVYHLREQQVKLSLVDNKLSVKTPGKKLATEQVEEIKSRKEEIMEYLRQSADEASSFSSNTAIDPVEEQDYYNISYAQRRLWIVEQLTPGVYNMPYYFNFETINRYAFEKAMQALIIRHEILRTSFVTVKGEQKQRVRNLHEMSFTVSYTDLQNASDQADAIRYEKQEDARKPFDLEKDALIRVIVLQLAADRHLVIVNIHHIIFDGWSEKVLYQDFALLYQYHLGMLNTLPVPLKVHYKDYTCWQLAQANTSVWKNHQAYWCRQFEKEIPDLSLVTDRMRPPVRNFDGEGVNFFFGGEVHTALQQICRDQGVTMFMALIAVTNILLYRYTNVDDIVIGSPIAGRDRIELEDQLGFYVNTLALRTKLNKDDSFISILRKVKEVTMGAYEHQQYPYNLLVEESGLSRDMSRTPLFDVMALLHNKQTEKIDTTVITAASFNIEKDVLCRFDLTFNYTECANAILVDLNYSKDIFKEDRMVRMGCHLKQLMTAIICQPATPVSKVEYLTAADKQQLLIDFNDRRATYPGDKSIPELFEEQAAKTPAATALVFGNQSVSYRELSERSTQVSLVLREKYGIQSGNLVALMTDRSLELIITILGILKAGAGYLPLDPSYPADRLKYMLDDTHAPLLLTEEACRHLWEDWNESNTGIINIDDLLKESRELSIEKWESKIDADNTAYVMYTSGSTGKPKGVVIKHRGVVRLVKNSDYFTASENDRLLQTGSISFDATTFEYYSMLLNGGQLHLLSASALFNAERLKEKLQQDKITVIWITSSWLNQLVDEDIDLFSGLRCVLAGGEKLSARHINKLRVQYPELIIVNGYGPTENTTFSACKIIDRQYDEDVPLGRPLTNSTVYLLDPRLNPVPVGIAGEIYLGGDGLAAGYLNRPELTHELFIDNPFQTGQKLYRSGDMGCWLNNGEIRFLSRKDDQVKIRGYRIEPGEIEAVLQEHEQVDRAVVMAQSDNESKYLVAYYSGLQTDEKELKEYISSRLPSYMVPSYIVYLSILPLTANGKIDRRILPAVTLLQYDSAASYEPPANEAEEKLAAIWKEVLQQERISATANFFELGGHSLKATQVLAKIYREFTVEISLSDIFDKPVLRDLAAFLHTSTLINYEPIEPVEEQEHYTISHAQQRLWVIEQFEDAKGVYNILYSVLYKKLDRQIFEKSIRVIMNRHQTLRTSFVVVDGEPRQRVRDLDESGFAVNYIDLRNHPFQQEEIKRIKGEEEFFVFDLANGPLIRVTLLHLYDEAYRVVINLHHIISDGWSGEVLEREFSAVLEAFEAGEESPLHPILIQYKDYSSWQKNMIEKNCWNEHRQYWHRHLADLKPLELPADYQRPSNRAYQGMGTTFLLDKAITDKLGKFCEQENATPFMALLACVKLLFFRYTGQEDIVTGTVVAGRDRAELENQLGFFVNTLILRSRFSGNDNFKELLQKVKKVTIDAHSHQQYPFDMLVDELDHNRSMNRSPFFDVVVDMQNFGGPLMIGDIPSFGDEFIFDSILIKFDLNFTFIETNKGLVVNVNYSTDLFSQEKIKQLLNHFVQLLYAVVQDPGIPISAVDYLTQNEKQQITHAFNSAEINCPPQKTIIQLFEEQAKNYPENIALLHSERPYSFRELNERSNQVANCLLQDCGVKKGEYIGILMKPGCSRIMVLLGILKAGAVYVPIDTEYPVSRTEYILADTAARLLFIDKNSKAELPADFTGQKIEVSYTGNEFVQYELHTPERTDDTEDVLCILYTSGSTGIPKGVYIINSGVVNRIDWLWHKYSFTEKDVIYQKTPYVFDVSMGEIFMPLAYGAKLLVAESNNSRQICEIIQQFSVTYIHFSPTLLNNFLDGVNEKDLKIIGSLRYFFASGEDLLKEIVKKFYTKIDRPLINLYGPTEASIEVSYYETKKDDEIIPIGKPIANVQLYVLDQYNNLLPVGIPGEVVIGGIAVSPGYLNQDDKTKERFLPDLFNPTDGYRLYKTGDVGRWNKNGEVEFLGRKDNQISINGLRIELGEIESALLTHPGIADVAVGFRKTRTNQYQLITHYVKKDKASLIETVNQNEQRPIVTKQDRERIQALNAHNKDYPLTRIHELFEAAVTKYPANTALVCAGNTLTYRELNERSNQLAHYISSACTLAPGDRAGILMDRSERMIIALLAVLKLGLTYVPVDAEYPEERICFMLEDASVRLLLTDKEFTPASIAPKHIIRYVQMQQALQTCPVVNLPPRADSGSPVYIMYTSGSTGKPKGVMVGHQSVTDYIHTFTEFFKISNNDTVIQQASIAFDTSVEEIFPVLCAGGKLVVIPAGGRDVDAIMQSCLQYKVSVLSTTPLVVNEINNHESRAKLSLRVLISGGDALKPAYIDKLVNQVKFYNTYGPTEATVCASFGHVTDPEKSDIIGFPITNHQLYLLDDTMQEVGFNRKGELYIGGNGLAIGYLNRNEETKAAFIQNPFDIKKRLYRTGDVAIRQPDGSLKFSGRIDHQVKIRGYRIEPAEVEQSIMKVPGIDNVCVMARDDQAGNKQLVAFYTVTVSTDIEALRKQLNKMMPAYMVPSYLVPIEKMPVTANGKVDYAALTLPPELATDFNFITELKEYLKLRLPVYMIPGIYIEMDKLPLTVTGKIDRKKLEQINPQQAACTLYIPPRTDTEKILAEIWRKILKKEKISIAGNFFELGGNSLKATQIITRIEQELEVSVPLNGLFNDPTIEGLAGIIKKLTKKYIPMEKITSERPYYPVSYAQRRLWVIEQFEEARGAYNMPLCVEANGLDRKAFNNAIYALLDRHEILRTTFAMIGSEPVQKIWKTEDLNFDIEFKDLRKQANPKATARTIIAEDANEPFDLINGPLLRVKLLQLEDEQFKILFNQHHIISDGWSINVLQREFTELYTSFIKGAAPSLPALPIQYKEYTLWQQSQFDKGKWDHHRKYWHTQLNGKLPILDLPSDYPRPAQKRYEGAEISFLLPKEEVKKLQRICQQNGATLFMGLMAAVKILLFRYTGQEDILIGSPIAGRNRIELEDQLGFYVNTLALRTRFGATESFEAIINHVKEVMLGAHDHQEYPFDLLVDELGLERDLTRSPLFDIMILHQADDSDMPYNERTDTVHNVISKFDITFSFTETAGAMSVGINYSTHLFHDERMQRMAGHLRQLIKKLITTPATPACDVEYLTQPEQAQLLYDFNGPKIGYPNKRTIHRLIEDQVAKSPETVAVKYRDRSLTYNELNGQANSFAGYLREVKGVKRNDVIGVMVSRTEKLPVILAGILKAGAAYLPLDPAYPLERLTFMSGDAQIKALVVDETVEANNELKQLAENFSLIHFEKEEKTIAGYSTQNPEPVNEPGDLAYLIYTSGTTGRPKGVCLTHQNAVALISWAKKEFAGSAFTTVFATTSYCFDLSVYEFFYSLGSGKQLRILQNAMELPEWIMKERDILINTVPSVMQSLLQQQVDLRNVNVLNIAGEPIPSAVIEGLDIARIEVRNLYGPSEYATYSTCYKFELGYKNILIGKPLDNTQVYILDGRMKLLPVGIKGEIYIAGEHLSRGYLNRDDLTTEKFLNNPFESGKKLYKTGDIGYWKEDGNIDYIGRKDNQVKLRGFRIELGEIETILAACKGVEQAAVVVRKSEGEDNYLAAYYSGIETTAEELKNALKDKLPQHMVPAVFIHLSAFPLSPNGKIDRSKLPDPSFAPAEESYESPATVIEEKLVSIWQEILKRNRIGVTDNFFEVGGQSLRAMQIVSRINQDLQASIGIKEIFNQPTIRKLAKIIEANSSTATSLIELNKIAPHNNNAFFLPPILGLSTVYRGLAAKLEGLVNCYGLLYATHAGKPMHDSIEDMAKNFADEIEKTGTEGEVIIAGYSMGGLVAFETAKYLENRGIKVRLVLLDREAKVIPFQDMISQVPEDALDEIFRDELGEWLGQMSQKEVEGFRQLYFHNLLLIDKYVLDGTIEGDIVAVEARDGKIKSRMNEWAKVTTGSFRHIYIDGTHAQVLNDSNLPLFIDILAPAEAEVFCAS